MTPDYLKNRTKQFGLAVIRLVESLPKSLTAGVIGKQVLRSATSVGANYRAVCRARSKPDFITAASEELQNKAAAVLLGGIMIFRHIFI